MLLIFRIPIDGESMACGCNKKKKTTNSTVVKKPTNNSGTTKKVPLVKTVKKVIKK
jgi:hypothetical protein